MSVFVCMFTLDGFDYYRKRTHRESPIYNVNITGLVKTTFVYDQNVFDYCKTPVDQAGYEQITEEEYLEAEQKYCTQGIHK